MSERLAFLVQVSPGGAPATGATPTFLVYKDKTGAALTPPTISHLGGGVYGFTAPDVDVAAGAAYLITTGASPAYLAGAVHLDSSPFLALALVDASGAPWTGAAPTVGHFSDFLGAPRGAPAVTSLGSGLYALVAPFGDLTVGAAYRVDSPAGALPLYRAGSLFIPSGVVAGESVGEVVYSKLVADPTVLTLVGTRIYPNRRPQNATLPCVVYSLISEVPENAFAASAQDRLTHARLQLDCYAKTYAQAHQIAGAVEAVVANLSEHDLSAIKESARDFFENETGLHRVQTDYLVDS